MHGHTDTAWRVDRRGFWTKRKKTAMSLFSVLTLVAGIAVAYKLFDQTVPNNVVRDASVFDFVIEKSEAAIDGDGNYEHVVGDPQATESSPIYEDPTADDGSGSPQGGSQFPGDTREVDVRITNTNTNPSKDASFEFYISNIDVFGCVDGAGEAKEAHYDGTGHTCPEGGTFGEITDGSTPWNRFVNFWTLEIDKTVVLANPTGGDLAEDGSANTCEGGLKEITDKAPCDLGLIRSNGSTSTAGDNTDQRDYVFGLNEADDGSNQSNFKGWFLDLEFVFNARLPALPEDTPTGTRS